MPEHARIQVKARVLRGGLERARIHETHGLVRLQRLVGNHAVQRLLAQRDYEPTKAEERDFTDLVPQKWGSGVTADGAKKLAAGWCRSHAQFLSLVNNFSWAEFVALTKKYKDGNLVPVKANDIRQKMQKEMQAELALIQQQKIERFRKECRGVKLTQAVADGWVTVAHHHTFRTDDEKKQKGGNPTGPFTRNFSAQVQNQAALWEVHVHYRDSKNQVVEKAHVKLITQRHSKDHVWDLPSNHAIVQRASIRYARRCRRSSKRPAFVPRRCACWIGLSRCAYLVVDAGARRAAPGWSDNQLLSGCCTISRTRDRRASLRTEWQ